MAYFYDFVFLGHRFEVEAYWRACLDTHSHRFSVGIMYSAGQAAGTLSIMIVYTQSNDYMSYKASESSTFNQFKPPTPGAT